MKETGIVMTGDQPAKILAGTKTQTRRLNKLHDYNKEPDKWNIRGGVNCWFAESIERNKYNIPSQQIYIKCPYGQVGDRLWVRETWRVIADDTIPRYGIVFKDGCIKFFDEINPYKVEDKWKPSFLLPKRASRITLEITGVRVERLQEITYKDARAEGILSFDRENPDSDGGMGYNRGAIGLPMRYESTAAFMDLWDSLNAKRGYGWKVNPWVWVLEFKQVDNGKKND